MVEKNNQLERVKYEYANFEEEIERWKREAAVSKDTAQRQNYELMDKDDRISQLQLEINGLNLRNREVADSRFRD